MITFGASCIGGGGRITFFALKESADVDFASCDERGAQEIVGHVDVSKLLRLVEDIDPTFCAWLRCCNVSAASFCFRVVLMF